MSQETQGKTYSEKVKLLFPYEVKTQKISGYCAIIILKCLYYEHSLLQYAYNYVS